MKYLFVGDYHIGISNNEKFLEYQKKSIQWAQQVAREHSATLVQLGDYVHKRTSIDFKILEFIENNILEKKCKNIPIHLTGNHDTYFKNNSKITFTRILELFSNYITPISIIYRPIYTNNILFVPWINDSNFKDCRDSINETKLKYCVGHFDIIGFRMTPGYNSPTGFDPKIFKKFKHVFSGHYHLNSTQDNITYVGSVCQLNWNDVNESKYVYLLDSETDEVTKFENELKMFHEVYLDENIKEKELFNYKDKYIRLYLKTDLTVKLQKIIDWFIDNNIEVKVISKEIQLHTSEMIEEKISLNIDNSINDGMKLLLDEMDLKKNEKKKIFDLFKKIQMESIT